MFDTCCWYWCPHYLYSYHSLKIYEIDYTQIKGIFKVDNLSNTNAHLTLNSLEDFYIIVIFLILSFIYLPKTSFFPSMDCFQRSQN